MQRHKSGLHLPALARHHRGLLVILLLAAVLVLQVPGCNEDPVTPPTPPSEPSIADSYSGAVQPVQSSAATPLQANIAQWAADRQAQGLPMPTISFEFSSDQGSSVAELDEKWYAPGEGYSYTARTVIHYAGPAEAGLEQWANFNLSDDAARILGVTSSEVKTRYVAAIESAHPGFWDRYQLGFEPRTYTVTETGTGTGTSLDVASTPRGAPADATAVVTTSDELVLGFSLGSGLSKNKSWSFGLEDVEELTFSVHLAAGLGLRLPLAAALEGPEPMDEGSSYNAFSTVHGVDWSAEQYSAAGVTPENGKEFYAKFQAEACVTLSGIIDYNNCKGPNFSKEADLVTPFGSGASLPLPSIPYTVADFGVAGVDVYVTPSAGSDKITAHWSVSGEAQGGGDLEYTGPALPVTLSPVLAVDGPGTAHYSVNDFRYYFNQFAITLGVTLWVDVEIPLFPDWKDSWSRNLATVDLSSLIGALDLSVGTHAGSSPTGLTMDAAILNVAPTADLSVAGGQVVVINGVPTVVGDVGEVITFTGVSHDPGRDDLTVSWDWGDGTPAPDQTVTYPVPGSTGPNNVTDVQTHAFGSACMYDVTFGSVDDDAASAEDHALVMVTASGAFAQLEGFWQHQLSGNGRTLLPEDILDCRLAMVNHVSTVFSEARDASTISAALNVLNLKLNRGSESEQLDRELLVGWLNFASGAIGYFQLVDTNEDGVPDTPMNEAMQAAEVARLDGSSTPETLRAYTQIVHKISEQFTRDFGI